MQRIINKQSIWEYQQENIINKNRVKIKYSGGTTGTPTKFLVNSNLRGRTRKLKRAFYASIGLNSPREILVWGHSKYLGAHNVMLYVRKIKDILLKRRVIVAYSLGEREKMKMRRLLESKGDIVVGYSSSVAFLLNDLSAPYKGFPVLVTGEKLRQRDLETMMSNGFDVYQEYGCSEVGIVAFSEKNTNLYKVCDSSVKVNLLKVDSDEFIDRRDTYARIVVSYLRPNGVRIENYEIGDHVQVIKGLGENTKYFGEILGRTYDVLTDANGEAISGVLFTLFESNYLYFL